MAAQRFPHQLRLVVAASLLWACGDAAPKTVEEAPVRDLRLATPDSTFRLNDEPLPAPSADAASVAQPPVSDPAPPRQPTFAVGAVHKRTPERVPVVEVGLPEKSVADARSRAREKSRRLGSGTYLEARLVDGLADKGEGDGVSATVSAAVRNAEGETVIPSGAVLRGRVVQVDGGGTYVTVAFAAVEIDGASYAIDAVAYDIRPTDAAGGWSGGGGVLGGFTGGGPSGSGSILTGLSPRAGGGGGGGGGGGACDAPAAPSSGPGILGAGNGGRSLPVVYPGSSGGSAGAGTPIEPVLMDPFVPPKPDAR